MPEGGGTLLAQTLVGRQAELGALQAAQTLAAGARRYSASKGAA
jgi:hypothetical protein